MEILKVKLFPCQPRSPLPYVGKQKSLSGCSAPRSMQKGAGGHKATGREDRTIARAEPGVQRITYPLVRCWLLTDMPTLQRGHVVHASMQWGFASENKEKTSSFTAPLLDHLHFSSHPLLPILIFGAHFISGTVLAARAVMNLDFSMKRGILFLEERWNKRWSYRHCSVFMYKQRPVQSRTGSWWWNL